MVRLPGDTGFGIVFGTLTLRFSHIGMCISRIHSLTHNSRVCFEANISGSQKVLGRQKLYQQEYQHKGLDKLLFMLRSQLASPFLSEMDLL